MYLEKTIIQKDTHTPMFIAVLFTIAIVLYCKLYCIVNLLLQYMEAT